MEKKLLTSREKPVEFSTPEEVLLPPEMISSMSGGWEQKVWGRTRVIALNSQRAVHELVLENPGSFCSIHHHEKRHNFFLVLSGEVRVVVRKGKTELPFLLSQGQSLFVAAGEVHQFRVVGHAHLLEVYLPLAGFTVDEEDIIRQHSGNLTGEPVALGSLLFAATERGA